MIISNFRTFPIQSYTVHFSIDRLVLGVDNIHYDVRLSPSFCTSAKSVVSRLMAKYSTVEEEPENNHSSDWIKERDQFKEFCRDVLFDAVNQAKLKSELDIDFLAQAAMAKMLLDEVRNQYRSLLERLKNNIRKSELAQRRNLSNIIRQKEEYNRIQKNKKTIFLSVGKELFIYFIEAQHGELKEIREVNFGPRAILPNDIFSNLLLFAENIHDDILMAEFYVLLGHRYEDLNSYRNLISLIKTLFGEIEGIQPAESQINEETPNTLLKEKKIFEAEPANREIDGWLKAAPNFDLLFNYFVSTKRHKELKQQQTDKVDLAGIKAIAKDQKALLTAFYDNFRKEGLLKIVVANYEMKSLYQTYCPPLSPHQILQFLTSPDERKQITNRLKRLKGFYGESFSIAPLRKCLKDVNKAPREDKEKYLLQYLKDFCRFHKDFENFNMITESMDRIHLAYDKKTINLSKVNRTLYSFLLAHEQTAEEKPIINHVIVKADVRGSTDLTYQMEKKGLNPASYFSLNFFEPITDILAEYSASKVFIEGDAIILSIMEHADTPYQWYSVARACGLAFQVLMIVRQYNLKNQENQLPKLELGVGISYYDRPPAFLFDGDNQIMLSPAINWADRLSGCSWSARRQLAGTGKPFNLYVFQTIAEKERSATVDDLSIRYNLNGIELSESGFQKLSKEIELKALTCVIPDIQPEKIKIHTGKFPTVTGKFKWIVIREDTIMEVSPENLKPIRSTNRKYFEVCSHPKIYEYVKNRT